MFFKTKYNYYRPLVLNIGKAFLDHMRSERITVSAGHLAYVSLLSLVPVIVVFFMIMSAFPAFEGVREQIENFIFTNFVPTAGDVLQDYMGDFVANASSMSAVSVVSLLVVALLLISNIDKTFNHIWRTQVQRPIIFTFAIYWMIITLGPLLIGLSIVVSSYLAGLAAFAEEYTPGLGTFFLKMVPSLAAIGAFLILYMIVPNRPVRAKYALCGAVLATILFEFTKKAFALYITSFPSYQLIYGALAVVPILFVWVYLSWIVVLLGAVFTYSITVTCDARDEHVEEQKDKKAKNKKLIEDKSEPASSLQ
ncbi:virulence factor BrkB family protein [Glaciecola sp. MH2013]|uniref:virulence factor BrkB family protein n=1 Tax=Glaciecola sp. MH2013 TaxID=2785524 RepID=UPI00351C5B7E